MTHFPLFLACAPGLEATLADEAADHGFAAPTAIPGGVTTEGDFAEMMRANLSLRIPNRVLMRIGEFRAFHLAQLDKRASKFPWGDHLPTGAPVKVEVTCRRSKIYHAGAARQRIEGALRATLGPAQPELPLMRVMARIDDNLVTLSLDTSGELLHKRGHKQAVGKAPLRETLAAAFLRQSGFCGDVPVFDPMCGSGTFVIEAAEMALGLQPGRARDFAFMALPGYDERVFAALKTPAGTTELRFGGTDRDQGVIGMAKTNAERASVAAITEFACARVDAAEPPDGACGFVMVNPPYGARIGDRKQLFGLYAALGTRLRDRFSGWRLGMVTSDGGLAKATGLDFLPSLPSVDHGGLKLTLYRTDPL